MDKNDIFDLCVKHTENFKHLEWCIEEGYNRNIKPSELAKYKALLKKVESKLVYAKSVMYGEIIVASEEEFRAYHNAL
jgi:hypothetical protein